MRRASSFRLVAVAVASAGALAGCAGDDPTAPTGPQASVAAASGPDTAAPELIQLAIGPRRVDVDVESRQVLITASATDEGTGAYWLVIHLASPSGGQTASCSVLAPDDGTPAPTTWQCNATIPRYGEPGDWTIRTLTLQDRLGNERQYTTEELRSAHFPTTVHVVSTTPDVTAPHIAAMRIDPAAVDVTADAATVQVRATLSDDLAGVTFAQFNLVSPSGNQVVWCDLMTLVSGDGNSGEWSCDLTIQQLAESGDWRIFRFWVQDATGNQREYTTESLEAAGFPTRVAVTTRAPDGDPPTLVDITVSPETIDLSGGSQSVEVSVVAADAGTGVDHVIVFVGPPDATSASGCLAGFPVEGDRSHGTFRCSIEIDAAAVAGEWKVLNVSVRDAVGNRLRLTTTHLEAAGYDVSFTVIR